MANKSCFYVLDLDSFPVWQIWRSKLSARIPNIWGPGESTHTTLKELSAIRNLHKVQHDSSNLQLLSLGCVESHIRYIYQGKFNFSIMCRFWNIWLWCCKRMESVSAGTKYLGIYGISCLYIRRVQGLISALEMIPSTSTALWGLYPCQKDVTEQLNSFRMKPQSPSFSTEVRSLKLWLEVKLTQL